MAGDTPTKLCSPEDKSVWPLFGDAGTVTALEFDDNSTGMQFLFNTDGNGAETIIVREGGYRNRFNEKSLIPVDHGDDRIRNGVQERLICPFQNIHFPKIGLRQNHKRYVSGFLSVIFRVLELQEPMG